MMLLAPILLLLALSLSWKRFSIIFHPGTGSGLEGSPLTMAASAVSIASLGLAIIDQGIATGAFVIFTGVLVSHLMPKTVSLISVAIACASLGAYLQVWNDDFLCTEIGQIGTHMDALGHLGGEVSYPCGHCETLVYNGNKLSEIWSPYGLKKLGIDKAPIFFTRGVLLDVEALLGGPLPIGFEVTPDHLNQCLDRQGMDRGNWLNPGDVVLIRTGHGSRFFSEAAAWYDGEPGLGLASAEFLSALEPVVVGADNFAVDVVPSVDPDLVLPCHQHLIMRHGIYLHEGMNLDGLARTGRHEFVYAFAPLRIEGATGSPGTPFAIL